MRTIRKIYNAPAKHWVGNGFYVSPLFSHMGEDKQTSPFLMFDYAMPHTFAPNNGAPRGVGAHPHSGFETVTIAYQGEVAHRDSTGSGGVIGEGDVQWMTAGAGIVHEEFHADSFGKRGGEFEMAQLWVNLPAKDKKTPARYQHLAKDNITVVPLADDAGHARIIAGRFGSADGAAETFTELNVWDIVLNSGAGADLDVPASHNLMLVVLRGEVRINAFTTRFDAATLTPGILTTGAGAPAVAGYSSGSGYSESVLAKLRDFSETGFTFTAQRPPSAAAASRCAATCSMRTAMCCAMAATIPSCMAPSRFTRMAATKSATAQTS
jgi:redox-sensitive bicupin YhaK (pirin superfamily)